MICFIILGVGEFCNMIERGVIDSFTVVTNALDDACSVASMILTTEAAIVKDKVYIGKRIKMPYIFNLIR